MFKFILLIILGYFVFKFFRTMLTPKQTDEKVRGKNTKPSPTKTMNNKKIEDADFEEIE